MFTGLIEETGVLESVRKGARSAVLRIRASKVTDGLKTGDSVAVNGVCLTAVTCDSTGFTADVMHETLRRSSASQPSRPIFRSSSDASCSSALAR